MWVDTTYGFVFPDGMPDGYENHPFELNSGADGHVMSIDELTPAQRWATWWVRARCRCGPGAGASADVHGVCR